MDRRLHDMRNDLAVAIGTLHALVDGKLAPDRDRLATILNALESLDTALSAQRAPASVTAKEHLLNAIIEGSPYAKILVNAGGTIVLVNAQTEELFGYSRDELLGRSIELLVPQRFGRAHPALRTHFTDAPVARAMGAGRDLYGRRKDGSEVPIEIGLNPVTAETETFTLAAVTDITERKRSEELRLAHAGMQLHAAELEELNRELARVSRFKTEFVATMSHELRTPLTAIIGAAELLAERELDERSRLIVQTLTQASEALFALIRSVLDFSKVEAGKLELDVIPFETGALVSAAVDVVAHLAHKKHVEVRAELDAGIPVLIGDRDRLRQILLNLLGNAVKFTDSGSIVVRAREAGREQTTVTVCFEVEDTGIGIARESIPSLFEPFVQADRSASRRVAGTGLGLSISRSLVELMGGEIGVDSTPGRGSLFWFTIPFQTGGEVPADQRVAHTNAVTPAIPARSAASEREAARGTVLVAEDNQQLRLLLQLQFDEIGVDAAFVNDGREALDAIAQRNYALILMDCQMPNMDGLEATRAIRRHEHVHGGHVPIAAMTANAFAEDRAACLAAGMDSYLAKPVKLAQLRALIASL